MFCPHEDFWSWHGLCQKWSPVRNKNVCTHTHTKHRRGNTWDGESTETYSQNEEGDGDPSSVRKSDHQQQRCFHTKSCTKTIQHQSEGASQKLMLTTWWTFSNIHRETLSKEQNKSDFISVIGFYFTVKSGSESSSFHHQDKESLFLVYQDVPPQFMSFLTFVVDMILLLRKKSASCPPIGTTIVITMWGTADRIPTCFEEATM